MDFGGFDFSDYMRGGSAGPETRESSGGSFRDIFSQFFRGGGGGAGGVEDGRVGIAVGETDKAGNARLEQ